VIDGRSVPGQFLRRGRKYGEPQRSDASCFPSCVPERAHMRSSIAGRGRAAERLLPTHTTIE
jgi:hypothetical protein